MLATIPEAIREWARNYGAEVPEQEWLCSDYDSWVRNPHYHGVRHVDPETAGAMADDGIALSEADFRERVYIAPTPYEMDCPF